jgi:hypothetical protein
VRGGRWIDRRGLAVGRDERERTVRIPVGHTSGRHALVVVATGSGKTVTQAWIAGRLIRAGHGAVVIDPKRRPAARGRARARRPQGAPRDAAVDARSRAATTSTSWPPCAAVRRRDVIVFRLEADRRPLLAGMLAAAIVQDLLTIAAELQHQPVPALVLVDEFSAVAPVGGAAVRPRPLRRLQFAAGTQELADLRPPDNPSLADQVLGNVSTLIAHRQMVPASAETLAGVIGTPRGVDPHRAHRAFLGAGAPAARARARARASSSCIPTPSSASRPATPP